MSSLTSKEIGILAGVSVSSLVVGGIFGYYLSNNAKKGEIVTENRVHKSHTQFASDLDRYIIENSLREPSILEELREYTIKNVPQSMMITDPVEGQLFRILLNLLNAKKCIEVGTFTGYNALNMALAMPPDGKVYALDINDDYVNHGRKFFEKAKMSQKIDVCIGPAADTMDALIREGQAGSFDFIFIDADKTSYDTYYEKGLTLLRSGGIIALDNMFQGGRVINVDAQTGNRKAGADALNKLNKKLKHDARVVASLLKIADGVTLCLKV